MTKVLQRLLVAGALCAFQDTVQGVSRGTTQATPPATQAPAPPGGGSQTTFRARTDTVVVDVVAIDDSGVPVEGLTSSDFVVTVEGSPRQVTTAAYVSHGGPADARPSATEDEQGYVTNQGMAVPRLLVFVVDESHVRPMAAKTVLETAAGMLDALAPNDLVAVARLPRLTQGQDFTTDRAAVRKALEQATGRGQPFRTPVYGLTLGVAVEYLRGLGPVRQELLDTQCQNRGAFRIGEGDQRNSVQRCMAEISGEARTIVDDFTLTAKDTAYALERLMETLGRLPGRKRVVLFSEGLYVGTDMKMLSRAQALAAQAQATVTVIKPETATHDASAGGPSIAGDPSLSLLDRGLDDTAGGTGGTLARVIGSGKAAFERIARELSGYYTVGFTPEPADRDGKRHSVKVRVSRPGVTVRARREFVIDDRRPLDPPEDRLKRLLGSTVMETALPVRASLLTAPVAGGRVRTFVLSIVGVDAEAGVGATGAAAVIDSTGAVVSSFALEPAALNDVDPRKGLVLGGARDLDPGEYRLRVAAVLGDGRAGSLETALVAKPRQAGEVSYSDLMVGLRPPAGQAFRPVPEPVVDRELLMAVELASAEADITSSAEVRFEIAETVDGEPLVEQPVEVPSGKRVAAAAASLQLTLPPGSYVARARIAVPDAEPVMLAKRFRVVGGAGNTVIGPRVDQATVAPPAVVPFSRERALRPDVLAPFVDHLAKAFPQGRAGTALLARAKTGQFDLPAATPADGDALAHSLVRGLAALRDNDPQACVAAFNDTIDRAGGFIGLALFQGDCYAASGHDRDAVAAWQMALLGNVGTPAIYEQLVDGLLRIGEAQQALDALAEGDLVWLDRPGFDRRRGVALALLDRHQEALPLLEAAASDPAADRDLLFLVLRSMHAGRKAGWLDASDDVARRFDGYLDRYAALQGPQVSLARDWRKGFTK
jgi:VWFA-related protein